MTKEEKERFARLPNLFISEENFKHIVEKTRIKERSRDEQGIYSLDVWWDMPHGKYINHVLDFVRTQNSEDFEEYLNHVLSNENNDHLDEK